MLVKMSLEQKKHPTSGSYFVQLHGHILQIHLQHNTTLRELFKLKYRVVTENSNWGIIPVE